MRLSCVTGPLDGHGPASILGQNCPQITKTPGIRGEHKKNTKHLVDVISEWPLEKETSVSYCLRDLSPPAVPAHSHVAFSCVCVSNRTSIFHVHTSSSVGNWHERNGKKSDQQTCCPSTFPIPSARDNNSGCGDVRPSPHRNGNQCPNAPHIWICWDQLISCVI